MSSSKLSFTIRRPTPVSRASSTGAESDSSGFKVPALPRHLQSANNSNPGSSLGHSNSPKRGYSERDSSDEEDDAEDELVTGFDQFGVQRLHAKKEPEGPLVIPALKNKDWREVARKRKNLYIPPSASAVTGADGSVGGLGTRDSINSGPQLSGLQLNKKPRLEETLIEVEDKDVKMEEQVVTVSEGDAVLKEETQETEDQRALKAIIASATSGDGDYDGPTIDTIPMHASEEDALQQDIAELPEPATLEDYERVPVSQFGAALLRGMGWKEGTAASRKTGKGLVEPWLPQARPALLGIGAKEKAPLDDGSSIGKKGGPRKSKPNMKYMPLVKVDRGDGSREGSTDRDRESGSGSSSRRRSSERGSSSRRHSPDSSYDRRREKDRDRYDSDRDRRRGSDRGDHRDSDRERDRDRDRDRRKDDRRDSDYVASSRHRERDRDGDRRRDRSPSYQSRKERDRDRRDY